MEPREAVQTFIFSVCVVGFHLQIRNLGYSGTREV
jgi:hypothetical protein